MIPNIEPFETLLDSLRTNPPENSESWTEVAWIDSSNWTDMERGLTSPSPTFWHRTDGLKRSALVAKLKEEMGRRDHISNENICMTVLALFAQMKPVAGSSAVARFNALLDRIVEADLNQYVVLGFPYHPELAFEVGAFQVGALDLKRFHRQCDRAGSDFAKRYSPMLEKPRLTVTRNFKNVTVLPWQTFTDFKKPEQAYPLIDEYYHQISNLLYPLLMEEFAKVQEITKALGGSWFDTGPIIREHGRTFISVFLNVGEKKMGWVCSDRTGTQTVDFGGMNKAVPDTTEVLREQFKIDNPHIDATHPLLQNFFHFLAVARDHHLEGRLSEAFLHLVIALDLVFGEKDKSTTTVGDRVAVLAHRGLAIGFDECRKLTKKIYDTRSKYVHRGKETSERDWAEASQLCEVVSFAMLRRFKRVGHQPIDDDNWLKRIDLVTAQHESGSDIDPELVKEIGVAQEGDYDVADYHRLLQKGVLGSDELGKFDTREFSFRHGNPN